jgi:hypothetical protein
MSEGSSFSSSFPAFLLSMFWTLAILIGFVVIAHCDFNSHRHLAHFKRQREIIKEGKQDIDIGQFSRRPWINPVLFFSHLSVTMKKKNT